MFSSSVDVRPTERLGSSRPGTEDPRAPEADADAFGRVWVRRVWGVQTFGMPRKPAGQVFYGIYHSNGGRLNHFQPTGANNQKGEDHQSSPSM